MKTPEELNALKVDKLQELSEEELMLVSGGASGLPSINDAATKEICLALGLLEGAMASSMYNKYYETDSAYGHTKDAYYEANYSIRRAHVKYALSCVDDVINKPDLPVDILMQQIKGHLLKALEIIDGQ